jgi:NAD(P)-dependent dehydrogenase (short-subunit alcohol dehydrogenase family)
MKTYTPETTAEEVAEDCSSQIANKTILVTGVSPSGLGAAFALAITKSKPACIILAARDLSKVEQTASDIDAIDSTVRTHSIKLDLESLEEIKKAAEAINSLDESIDVIVNNAGIMACPYGKTVDGIERHFAVNHIGHFLLTNLLLPKMLARSVPIRVINVSSNGFRFSPVRYEDWNFDVRSIASKCSHV